jgi:hypothetical protein
LAAVGGWREGTARRKKIRCYGALVPVNSTHPDYDANAAAWQCARDVIAGEAAVKAAGERYLPRLESQTDDDYKTYKMRAAFFNATARTLDALSGLVFRADLSLKVPKNSSPVAQAMAAFVADVNLSGTALDAYAKQVVSEVIGLGRAGTLVDWSGERAAAVFYAAEQILNWRTERVNERDQLTLVVLAEKVEGRGLKDEGADEFESGTVEQLRVLRLVVVDGQRQLMVEAWQHQRKGKEGREWHLVERRTPRRLGRPLTAIPFIFHGPRHSQAAVAKLPLADIIALNLDHYRLDADFKHGLHFTALPTAWVAGFDANKSSLSIGSRTAWVSENKDARAGFLEFTGQGLTTFERAQDRDERLMAVLGTRMLESQKRAYESAESIELRQTAENSALGVIAISVGQSLTSVLRWAYWWHSTEAAPEAIGPDVVLVELNQDFNPRALAGEELVAVVSAWQAGAISRETMMDLLRRGEVLPPGRSNEEEARLAAGNPKTEGRNPKVKEQQ